MIIDKWVVNALINSDQRIYVRQAIHTVFTSNVERYVVEVNLQYNNINMLSEGNLGAKSEFKGLGQLASDVFDEFYDMDVLFKTLMAIK